jgi:2-polyprenyl-6-methoxyphenol hydroxylase-like FAD-dependent oxidoreductase
MKIAITGGGMAANCCAQLLRRDGIETILTATQRPPVPVIMLSDAALALLRDVVGNPALFADKPRIARRIVSWGGSKPVAMPHGAIVLSEADLAAALAPSMDAMSDAPSDFTIHTAPPFPADEMQRFGSRQASAVRVSLRHAEDQSACWIEAVGDGWLFLIPGETATWLLGVGAAMDSLISKSRHISPRIDLLDHAPASFETCPRMLTRLHGADWLACGTAAIAFDPICGDGTAQAVREAILASAVINAIRDGGDARDLLAHFEAMLVASMRRHLKLCADFYRTGGTGPWWDAQIMALAEGFAWCTARLAVTPEPRYQLQDFRLIERNKAA